MRLSAPAWSRNLVGQMVLLVAGALFIAQAINFAMMLEGRRSARDTQLIAPAITRLVDGVERMRTGRTITADRAGRGRIRLSAEDPIGGRGTPFAPVELKLRAALSDAGLSVRAVRAQLVPVRAGDPALADASPGRAARMLRDGRQLIVAAQIGDGRWVSVGSHWPRSDAALVWPLIIQTLVLYAVVMLAVLWIGRRLAGSLAELGRAAHAFGPGGGGTVAERGPDDVQALIAAFNALQLRVTAMLEEKDRMLGAIGHDLRTPLAALRVRVESVEDDEDRTRMVATIDEMNRMLDDILSLARAGQSREPVTDVDLAALVDAVVEDFRDIGAPVSFAETGRVKTRLRPGPMRRAVRNLIENAIKYGEHASVRIDDTPQALSIIVDDDGPGIPDDRLEDVFTAFTRLEESRNRETGGSGLGLALARAVVREAGGEIMLVNPPEGGLSARIVLRRV